MDANAPGGIAELEEAEARKQIARIRPSARRVFLDPSTPSVRSIVRVVVIVLVILAIASFLENAISSLTHLFFIVILAVFFAYFIEPLIRLIQSPFEKRTGRFLPRPMAIAVAYLIVFGGIGLAVYTLAPTIVQQAQDFGANVPSLVSSIQTQSNSLNRQLQRYRIPPTMQTQITESINGKIASFGENVTTMVGETVFNAAYIIPWIILIPILAFFFLKDVNLYRIGVLRVFPAGEWRQRVEVILIEVNTTLRAYVRAQMLSCLIIGTICTTGFYLLGLNYALLLGVLAGIFEFIPLIGPLTLAVLAITVAGFSNSGSHAAYTAVFLGVLRIIHDYVTYPRIVRGGIHLHPLAIILSVLAGEQIAGIPGVFLSIPIVAIATVIYKQVLEHNGSKGLLSGLLEPKRDEVSARLVEDKNITPQKIDEKIEVREAKKEEFKEVVRDAVTEIKKS
jgi:predicted PurR-regulated permease PerM